MFIGIGGGALGVATALALLDVHGPEWRTLAASALSATLACYGLGMAAYMTYVSRIGKLKTRNRLLQSISWSGTERVLDAGCGRGLMAIGAARYVPSGEVVGVDLWSAADQSDNTPEAARENVRQAGVAARVRIDTGDVRELPYDDASFDVVLSHWVVHNLPNERDRVRALTEMLRVLRPGGVLIVADISHHMAYVAQLRATGVTELSEDHGGLQSAVIGVLSGNSFRPQAVIATKGVIPNATQHHPHG